jgi:phosphatidylserine/phosphatidylglycerophosphate/cardiolipin synthase-like enzyme
MDKIRKGIDVKVLVGKHKSISDEIKKIPNLKLFHSSKEMHIKVVIIDNQSAFLMSANITESSLENKLETGFYINDQEMIQSLKNYLSKNQ